MNPMFMILLTLEFYATGSFQTATEDIINVNKGTASGTIQKLIIEDT